VYYTPADGRNLNRMFPGRAEGTLSERTAHVVFTQVMQRADAYVDLHGGDANEALRPYVATRVTGDSAFDARVRTLARATGLELLVETPVPTPVPSPAGTTTMASVVNRIVGFTVEWGMLGRADSAAVDGHVRAVLGVAHALGMEQGRALRGGGRIVLAGSRTATAPASGLVRVHVTLDQVVREGERVATITDLFGVHLADVLAPAAGRVIAFTATPPVRAGEPVVAVGVLPAR
jgi:predicted deacylase